MKLFIFLSALVLTFLFTSCGCDNPPTCEFQKGDEVKVKSARWGKQGTVIDTWVSNDCDCMCSVSMTTWIEGKRTRVFTEYELNPANSMTDDAKDLLEYLTD